MGAKIDRRTLLAGAGAAALAPAAVRLPTQLRREWLSTSPPLSPGFEAQFRSNFDRDYVEKALSRRSGLAAFSVAG